MENLHIYKEIEELAHKLGFVDFGVAHSCELTEEKAYYLKSMDSGYFASMNYLYRNLDKRFNPSQLVEGGETVLVFLAPYSLPKSISDTIKPIGVAEYALGADYHKIIKDKLFTIIEHLKQYSSNFIARAFTDSAPILERAWAVKAGLGFIGQNNFLISPTNGIKNLIGVIVTNLSLPDKFLVYPTLKESISKAQKGCKTCNKCLQACKNGSLTAPYTLDARKCTSFLTIECKEMEEHMQKEKIDNLNGWYYGCDICMNVCPWNAKNKEGWGEFRSNLDILSKANMEWWCNLDDSNFNKIFKDSPLLRGGKSNIVTALQANTKKSNPSK